MKKIATVLTEGFEDSEATSPIKALRDEGYTVKVVSPKRGEKLKGKHDSIIVSDEDFNSCAATDFDGLLIPGGHSPERLRLVQGAVEFVDHSAREGKPIAAICHGPQLLISADALKGRNATCYDSIAVDVVNAGAHYEDKPVVVDRNLVTSRKPDDLDDFNREMLGLFRQTPASTGV